MARICSRCPTCAFRFVLIIHSLATLFDCHNVFSRVVPCAPVLSQVQKKSPKAKAAPAKAAPAKAKKVRGCAR